MEKRPLKKEPVNILGLLRKAVEDDGRPHAAIALLAGIHVKTFSAFMHARRGLSADTIEKLARALGMEIRVELTPVKQAAARQARAAPRKSKNI